MCHPVLKIEKLTQVSNYEIVTFMVLTKIFVCNLECKTLGTLRYKIVVCRESYAYYEASMPRVINEVRRRE